MKCHQMSHNADRIFAIMSPDRAFLYQNIVNFKLNWMEVFFLKRGRIRLKCRWMTQRSKGGFIGLVLTPKRITCIIGISFFSWANCICQGPCFSAFLVHGTLKVIKNLAVPSLGNTMSFCGTLKLVKLQWKGSNSRFCGTLDTSLRNSDWKSLF